ncbi:MAG: hypothetical protein AVDCRST_MAG85-3336 [uncultured Solirubrobacteraceae bacterium]|uniref:DUF6916 domain-containing protein n=1 Tax=uncultured Solirubrobacteraceae bacterium TaxID=1162706 RepID=A0A6J4TNN9_9ACTN|nr:MAG: hypothetical protein AVDCRST_MAG85-3336 [uncultured Solirubrobacteraceae bacterium]
MAETFTVAGVAMTLTHLGDVAGASKDRSLAGDDDVFVLTFDGPTGIDAGIHPVHHPDLGAFSLYLGPVESPGKTQRYEALIDRSIKRPRDLAAPVPVPPVVPAVSAPTAEPTLEQEHAAYVAAAQEGVALAREARAAGHDVSLVVPVPTKEQVRRLRKARKKAKTRVRRPAAKRKPAVPRRAAKPVPRRGNGAAARR